MSALGQKRTYAPQQAMSALPLIATAKADMPQMVMSALPPKADMCGATGNVGYGPIADIDSARNPGENPGFEERSFHRFQSEKFANGSSRDLRAKREQIRSLVSYWNSVTTAEAK
jgi:hypothetical protein